MVAVQGDGQIVHLKGQVSLDRSGSVVGVADMEIQVETVLNNIQSVLKGFGGGMQVAPGLYKLVDLPDLQGLMLEIVAEKRGRVRARIGKERKKK